MSSVRLERLESRHLASLDSLIHDPETLRFTRFPDPPPPDFPERWLERYEQGRRDGTREAWAVVEGGSGDVVGVALAPAIDRRARTVELGYAVSPERRGKGVATEALRLLTEWALADGALRVELLISADNEASRRVAARCGYVREGLLRSLHVKGDERRDTEIWSRLPRDPWPGDDAEGGAGRC